MGFRNSGGVTPENAAIGESAGLFRISKGEPWPSENLYREGTHCIALT